jgi:hypothetical protein
MEMESSWGELVPNGANVNQTVQKNRRTVAYIIFLKKKLIKTEKLNMC